MKVSLLNIAREVYESSDNPNRFELIDTIIERIEPTNYEDALYDALRRLTPSFNSQFRLQAMRGKPQRLEPIEADYSGRVEVTSLGTGEAKVLSPRRSGYLQQWLTFINQTIPGVGGEPIFIRDATVADLRLQAETRTKLRDGLNAEIVIWTNFADRLEATGKRVVGDIDDPEGMHPYVRQLVTAP